MTAEAGLINPTSLHFHDVALSLGCLVVPQWFKIWEGGSGEDSLGRKDLPPPYRLGAQVTEKAQRESPIAQFLLSLSLSLSFCLSLSLSSPLLPGPHVMSSSIRPCLNHHDTLQLQRP